LSLQRRWRTARLKYAAPNLVLALAAVGIIAVVLIAGVKRGYIGSTTVIFLVSFVPSVILHEVSHGVVALWCGDDTAKRAKRLTLNPLRHIDPLGSIVVPILMVLSGGPAFGWAKPVPVRVDRLRHPRDQAVLVSLAGPMTNIILAAIAGVVFHFLLLSVPHFAFDGLIYPASGSYNLPCEIALYFGVVNVVLAVFNLIPIPPLDGSALLERFLPASLLPGYYRLRFFFIIVVLLLVFFKQGALSSVLGHFTNWYQDVVSR
jgi:Zn-dependent protease